MLTVDRENSEEGEGKRPRGKSWGLSSGQVAQSGAVELLEAPAEDEGKVEAWM